MYPALLSLESSPSCILVSFMRYISCLTTQHLVGLDVFQSHFWTCQVEDFFKKKLSVVDSNLIDDILGPVSYAIFTGHAKTITSLLGTILILYPL